MLAVSPLALLSLPISSSPPGWWYWWWWWWWWWWFVVVVLIWAPLSVKDTDGQLIGLWHPVTNFASVRLVQCPQTRGQFSSCVPVTFCGTLLPRSSRHYCRWDGTVPFVCCPQQPTSQPLIHKSKVLIQCLLSSTFNMCNTMEQSHEILYHVTLFTSGWLPQGPS
jgi:hypothetical protein